MRLLLMNCEQGFLARQTKTISLLLAYLFLLTTLCVAQSQEKMEKEIQKIIKLEPSLRMDEIPGYMIGIIRQDSTYTFGYGEASGLNSSKPNAQSIFELGGLSKVFTASLLEILAADGKIHLDSSLNSCLPVPYRNPRMNHVTLTNLLAHASGLPKMPLEFGVHEAEPDNPYAHYSKKDLAKFYQHFIPPKKAPGYIYSHVNYALLEIAIEFKLQQSFENLMETKVLVPLGLEKSFIRKKDSLNIIQGHSIGGQETTPWSFASFAGSEGMKSCMQDLLHFTRMNLSEDAHSLSPILQKTHAKLTVTDYSKKAFSAKGWHAVQQKKFYVLIHTGNTSGFRSFLAFIPETQTAVAILANSEGATGGLGFLILRMINHNWNMRKSKIKPIK